jgi:hypothetical protein
VSKRVGSETVPDELSRYRKRSVLPLRRALLPAVGVGATFTFIMTGLLLPALVTGVVAALATWLVVPRSFWSGGLDMTTLSPADYSRWDHVRPFLPGGLAMAAGLLPGDGVVGDVPVWPFYFLGTTAALLWTARVGGRRSEVVGRRRARAALTTTPLEEATTTRLRVAAEHREVLLGLAALGAVDGIRARVWKLAETLGRAEAEIHDDVVALRRQGVVGVSTIDAGEDTSRHLVEITPVGVRVMAELHRR